MNIFKILLNNTYIHLSGGIEPAFIHQSYAMIWVWACRGSSLSGAAQTSISPATTPNSSAGTRKHSQARRET